MKRALIILLLSVSCGILVANSPVNFGLNFRLNMPRSSFESEDWDNAFSHVEGIDDLQNVLDKSETGYAGGVFLRFNKGKGFLHSEAMFSFNSTGFSALDGTTQQVVNYASESTTFNVPVFLGSNIINSKLFKVRAFTGPQFSWIMNASATGTRDGVEINDFDSDFEFDNFTWGWAIGAGVELFMFSLDVRYNFDVKGIEGANSLKESFNQKTNMVEFTLGFQFF